MALVDGEKLQSSISGFSVMPLARQIAILIMIAASVAVGTVVVLWAKEPNYRPLYQNLSAEDGAAIADAMQQAGIPHKIDGATGTLLVDGADLHRARMIVAKDGLHHGSGSGFERLGQEQGLGTSQFMERARYVHAMEGELARTIAGFSNVKSARVHVAIPRQSVFVRESRKPTASVFVDLYGGRHLSDSQVSSIVNLVATSVPNLTPENVTVVDQKGNLLTDGDDSGIVAQSDKQFKYTHKLEQAYMRKIEDLLTPLFGVGKVKARVSADLDFTQIEQTKESYNPDFPALRSEQIMKESKSDKTTAIGIPGAVSNDTISSEEEEVEAGEGGGSDISNHKEQLIKNYELDKTISRTQQQPGKIKRLSVAVLIDNHSQVDPDTGEVQRTPISQEEIERVKKLVYDAIGYNPKRGDSVTVINSDFKAPPPIEELPPVPMWEQGWFWDVTKQVLGGIFILLLVFGVIKPALRNLSSKGEEVGQLLHEHMKDTAYPMAAGAVAGGAGGAAASAGGGAGGDDMDIEAMLGGPLLSYEDQMRAVKNLAQDDPKRVAQVVKRWLDSDG